MCIVLLAARGAGPSAFVGPSGAPDRSFVGRTLARHQHSPQLTREARRGGLGQRYAAAVSPSRRRQAPICALAVDLRFVRDNAALVAKNAADRAVAVDVPRVVALYDEVAERASQVRDLRTERNEIAERMKGAAKMLKEERDGYVKRGKQVKDAVADAEFALDAAEKALEDEASKLPNMSHPDVPVGSEENAALLGVVGQKRDFAAEGMQVVGHLDTAIALDIIDFENAARVSGAKFYYMRNAGALLELALVNWAMSTAAAAGFTVMTTPDVARESVVAGCGFQPRGESSQVYRI
jgi:seryl-tRNA synthetase